MSKLFKLKEWFTIPDAARHLSGVFGETVAEADILRLALDGKLTISVDLVNGASARAGSLITKIEALRDGGDPEKILGISKPASFDQEEWNRLQSIQNNSDLMSVFSFAPGHDLVTTLTGVWDLPLIGTERLDIEDRYQKLTGGPSVIRMGYGLYGGALISKEGGELYVLCEQIGAPAAGQDPFHSDNYFLSSDFPADSVLVIRASALRHLESLIADESIQLKPAKESARENKNLLRIIGLMASQKYGGEVDKPWAIAGHLSRKAVELGLTIGQETIAKRIRSAIELMRSEFKKPTDPN